MWSLAWRSILNLGALLLAAALTSGALAQEQTEGRSYPPIFELVNPSGVHLYILGTVHILPSDTPWLSDNLIDALEASDLIVLEADANEAYLPHVQSYILEHARYTDGRTLQSDLSKETYDAFAEMIEQQGLSIEALSGFRPWFLAFSAGTAFSVPDGIIPQMGVDLFLQNWVFARGDMSIAYFETTMDVIDILANLPREQELELFEGAAIGPDELMRDLRSVVDAWSEWDEQELHRLSFGRPSSVELRRTLLDARNFLWVDQINVFARSHDSLFVAVGAGHLVGENNLIELLEAQDWNLQE